MFCLVSRSVFLDAMFGSILANSISFFSSHCQSSNLPLVVCYLGGGGIKDQNANLATLCWVGKNWHQEDEISLSSETLAKAWRSIHLDSLSLAWGENILMVTPICSKWCSQGLASSFKLFSKSNQLKELPSIVCVLYKNCRFFWFVKLFRVMFDTEFSWKIRKIIEGSRL